MYIPLPAFRVLVALFLCAACFQAGRWVEMLSVRAATPASAAVPEARRPAPSPIEEPLPGVISGHPDGRSDIITPLNVRDPSALVMGPGFSHRPLEHVAPPPEPAAVQPVTPPAPPEPAVPLKPKKGVVPRGDKEPMEPTPEKY